MSKTLILFVQSPYQNRSDLGRLRVDWTKGFTVVADYKDFCGYIIVVDEHHLPLNKDLFSDISMNEIDVELNGKLRNIFDVCYRFKLLGRTADMDAKREEIISGPNIGIKRITEDLSNAIFKYEMDELDKPYTFESGHSTSLYYLTTGLGYIHKNLILQGSELIFEVYHDENTNKYSLKVTFEDKILDVTTTKFYADLKEKLKSLDRSINLVDYKETEKKKMPIKGYFRYGVYLTSLIKLKYRTLDINKATTQLKNKNQKLKA